MAMISRTLHRCATEVDAGRLRASGDGRRCELGDAVHADRLTMLALR
jgi:hypothetical protein